MLPFALPIANVPNFNDFLELDDLFFPLIDGSGRGGKANAVIADGI
jgi:hypothetical protein